MFGMAWSELLVILVVALVVMNPKDIPAVVRTVRECIGKLQDMKREMMSVIHSMDQSTGISEMHQSLKQEAAAVNQQIRKIVDLDGNLQDAYDLSDLRPDLKSDDLIAKIEAADAEPYKKTTIH